MTTSHPRTAATAGYGAVLRAFARNDTRNIRRDSMLIGVLFGPFAYAFALWFVPPLTRFAATEWRFDLTPYHPLIVSSFTVLGPAAVLGSLCGLLLLDEKDQHTLAALRVTPAPPAAYPAYRAAMTVGLVTATTVLVLALCRLVPAAVVARGAAIGLLGGLLAVVIALLMAGPANNKVEGLALGKAVSMPLMFAPLVPYFFLDSPWQLAFGVLPSYWPARALWAAMDDGVFWPYIAGGLVYNLILVSLLVRLFAYRFR
ncbi:fluoroquinolones efflux ABC transporter permease [Pseudonocardia eucalypti]|uniref:Fluoroquinolones efflux ABC transporter permease n=1 Tax=Pseudonocardia eucalypti TaxID=648755 RepID=A0ABP9QHY3_9PSEU|nr:fluoroquinolone transport system permease protein [Pseudonocardia eucalypti]